MKNTILSIPEMRKLREKLPRPVSTDNIGSILFDIYKAKNLFEPDWQSETMRKLVLTSRSSYYKWGDIQLLDDDDRKAAIYLINVSYPASPPGIHDSQIIDEWLSYRFIPASGEPRAIEELALFVCNGEPVLDAARRIFFRPKSDHADFIINSSRLCGVLPFFRESTGDEGHWGKLPTKHRSAALSFALINDWFLRECLKKNAPFRYLFDIIQDEIIVRVLSIHKGEGMISPVFRPAYSVLGLPKRAVRLDREALRRYVYRFPLYFLDNEALFTVLKRLMSAGKLTRTSLEYHLENNEAVAHFLSDGESYAKKPLQNLDKLFTIDGPIKGSQITGEELRETLNNEVGDNPGLNLHITSLGERRESVQRLIREAKTISESL